MADSLVVLHQFTSQHGVVLAVMTLIYDCVGYNGMEKMWAVDVTSITSLYALNCFVSCSSVPPMFALCRLYLLPFRV